MAFMSRCKLTEMTVSHRNKDVFPYTTEELALYMKDYITKNLPLPISNIIEDVLT